METLIRIIYWVAQVFVVLLAVIYAFNLWDQKHRRLWAWLLVVGGLLWHLIRGLWTYHAGSCAPFEAGDGLLIRANKCIPPTADDVVWAQIAILAGLFVIIAERFRRTRRANPE